jgi:hypothetical protein
MVGDKAAGDGGTMRKMINSTVGALYTWSLRGPLDNEAQVREGRRRRLVASLQSKGTPSRSMSCVLGLITSLSPPFHTPLYTLSHTSLHIPHTPSSMSTSPYSNFPYDIHPHKAPPQGVRHNNAYSQLPWCKTLRLETASQDPS